MITLRTTFCRAAAASAVLALAGCVPPAGPEPAPHTPAASPAPRPTPAPTPASRPVAVPGTWMDVPQTPGDWRYRQSGNVSAAEFGAGQFRIECNRANRTVSLIRPGGATGTAATMHVLTETRDGTLGTSAHGQQPPSIAATLPAGDPLLDAMAFSKGRFAIETSGLPTLYLPSWPEVTRVIEDCR